ncbi:Caspase Dronc [Armadillidium vulgare]|nr:Caspase Dronc [Armadillidium vulgare]
MEGDTFLHKRDLDFIAQELASSELINNVIYDFFEHGIISERCMRNLLSLESTLINKGRRIVTLILGERTQNNQAKIAEVFYRNGFTSVADMFDPQFTSNMSTRDSNCNLNGDLHILPNLHNSASLPSLTITPHNPPSPDSTMSLDEDRSSNYCYNNLRINVTPSKRVYGGTNHKEIYKNESQPRGYVFLANTDKYINNSHTERVGSIKDVKNLKELFNQMGYLVEEHLNLGKGAFYKALEDFRDDERLSEVDSCIVVVMSHGQSAKEIITADNKYIRDEEIISYFTNIACPALSGKPKIFIFQYCRGTQFDVGFESFPVPMQVSNTVDQVRKSSTTDGVNFGETVKLATIPSCTDIYVVYASIEGHVAYLHEERGSWLIQSICVEFMENAHNTDFETLMKMVSRRIARDFSSQEGRKQQIERSIRGFDKHFYFNPQPLWNMDPFQPISSSLNNLQDLNYALPPEISSSINNLPGTPPHELRARVWEAESRSSTPDILSPYDIQNSGSGVWYRSRHSSGASLGSKDPCSHSPATTPLSGALKQRNIDSRRFSFGNAITENERMATSGESVNEVNSTMDEVDFMMDKITGTGEDFRKYRLFLSSRDKIERPSSFKRQLSAPTESEAMKKLNSLEQYLQINDLDEFLPHLNPVKEAINRKKQQAKKKKREINTPDF